MSNIFRALEFLGLSVWLGSDIFLSFVVAPGAFRVLAPNRDQAGAVVGFALTKMHLIGIACGVVILLVRLIRTKAVASLGAPAALCLMLMIALTAKLLDVGFKLVIVLLNDSVQLLGQNLERFQRSGLAPSPKKFSEVLPPEIAIDDQSSLALTAVLPPGELLRVVRASCARAQHADRHRSSPVRLSANREAKLFSPEVLSASPCGHRRKGDPSG